MPLTTEDRLNILDIYARQAWAIDTGDVEAYVETFAEDALLDLAKQHHGRQEIRRFAEEFRARDFGLPGSQHHIDQIVMDGDGNNCSVRAYVTRTYRMSGRGRNNTLIIWQGYYMDSLVKRDGQWLIQQQVGRAWEGAVLDKIRRSRQASVSA